MYISILSRLSRMAGDRCRSCMGYILRITYRVSIPDRWRKIVAYLSIRQMLLAPACPVNVYLLTACDRLLDTHNWQICHASFFVCSHQGPYSGRKTSNEKACGHSLASIISKSHRPLSYALSTPLLKKTRAYRGVRKSAQGETRDSSILVFEYRNCLEERNCRVSWATCFSLKKPLT